MLGADEMSVKGSDTAGSKRCVMRYLAPGATRYRTLLARAASQHV